MLAPLRTAGRPTALPAPAPRPAPWFFALAYLAGMTLAEVLVALVDARWGVPLHALILLTLLWHGARAPHAEQRFYWSLTLAPLIRILSLSLPLGGFPLIWWYVIISAPLFLTVAVAARTLGYGPAELGLRWCWRHLPAHLAVGLLGFPLGLVEYLILRPLPLATEFTASAVWLPAAILLVSTGFQEELIFRGLMQRAAASLFGRWTGPLLITTLFAVLHIGYRSWSDLAFVLLAGGLFALVAGRTGSIWGVTLAHGAVNATLFLVAPFLIGAPRL
jgi:membrane protease YdiL (CAAX protease family)